ncbi:MAG: radical SAM protein, partial [Coriobacteriia bacterium]|nr:radical SAM protein [Coriobacteriia bacterium]
IKTIKETPTISKYIDLPLQHSEHRILHAMNRKGSKQEYLDLIQKLRDEIPDMVIRTTFISGFPSETEEEHEELLDFIETAGFDFGGVFMYSPEESTRAYSMQGQIDDETKLMRAQEVKDLMDQIGFAKNAARIGQEAEIIVEGYEKLEDGSLEVLGRAWFQAPDTDGLVHVPHVEAEIGDRIYVRFTDAFAYDLLGEVVE